jgi:enoyl-CoA hydratase
MAGSWTSAYRRLILQETEPGILEIILHQPETLNALDAVAHRELTYVWREIDADPSVRVALVRGAGQAFSAGGDFSLIEEIMTDPRVCLRVWKEARDLVYNVIHCEKPIVSAIEGPAVGAGLAVALLADISVAARGARLLDGHVRLGVAAGGSRRAGLAVADRHGQGEILPAPQRASHRRGGRAAGAGFVVRGRREDLRGGPGDRPAPGPGERLRDPLDQIRPQQLVQGSRSPLRCLHALEFLGFRLPDAREGLQALREKRPPRWPLEDLASD